MGTLRDLAKAMHRTNTAFVFVSANAESSGNVEFDETIWGLLDEGVDDRFVGINSKKLYVKFLFDESTKDDLIESGFGEFVARYVGAIFIFKRDDVDEEPESLVYYDKLEDLEARYESCETLEGGREESPDEEDGEASDEDGSEDDEAEDIDEFIWKLVDGDVGCDDEVGEVESEDGWYGLFKFDDDTRQLIIDAGYEDGIEGIAGAIVYFREGEDGAEESVDYYAGGDLETAWKEIKGS